MASSHVHPWCFAGGGHRPELPKGGLAPAQAGPRAGEHAADGWVAAAAGGSQFSVRLLCGLQALPPSTLAMLTHARVPPCLIFFLQSTASYCGGSCGWAPAGPPTGGSDSVPLLPPRPPRAWCGAGRGVGVELWLTAAIHWRQRVRQWLENARDRCGQVGRLCGQHWVRWEPGEGTGASAWHFNAVGITKRQGNDAGGLPWGRAHESNWRRAGWGAARPLNALS